MTTWRDTTLLFDAQHRKRRRHQGKRERERDQVRAACLETNFVFSLSVFFFFFFWHSEKQLKIDGEIEWETHGTPLKTVFEPSFVPLNTHHSIIFKKYSLTFRNKNNSFQNSNINYAKEKKYVAVFFLSFLKYLCETDRVHALGRCGRWGSGRTWWRTVRLGF